VSGSERHLLVHGAPGALPERVPLRAGPLTLVFEAGDLRDVSLAGRVVVRRIYGAVRDQEWGTVPAMLSELAISAQDDRFRIGYRSEHREGVVDFVWRAAIDGEPDGTITFTFSGEARSTFARNRIGLCVLHPMRECAGIAATARLLGGRRIALCFPDLVSVQQPMDGFSDLAGLEYDTGGGPVALAFEGDAFETEDQRNWIDASFKTYSTPLSRPRPVVVPRGTRVEQRVTIRLPGSGSPGRSLPVAADRQALAPRREAPDWTVPAFGVGLGALEADMTGRELERLHELHPAHVRLDLPLAAAGWQDRLARALEVQRAVACGLEIALHVSPDCGAHLDRLTELLPRELPVARLLISAHNRPTTTADALELVRVHLIRKRPDLGPIGAGSRLDLYEFHLYPPPAARLIFWGMNPHAHASDLTSLAETPAAAAAQVRTVRARHPAAATAITPITLRRRPRAPAPTPPGVDPLHRSLFGAAWTLGMAAHLAEVGANSATFYEGVEELSSGDGVFPLLHVLADVCECAGGRVVPMSREAGVAGDGERSSAGARASLLVERRSGAVLMLANLSPDECSMPIPSAFAPAGVRLLDETTARRAATDWKGFRRDTRSMGRAAVVDLGPFATARLDGEIIGRR
jgi:D-apionolactonase